MKLTGKKRYRNDKRLFRKPRLVLQVQYSVNYMKDLNGSGYYDEWTNTYWRDATLDDVIVEVTI